ncbi:MAG: hypothetical protein ABMA13_19965 [Chthoniobacteraceae bacterium]
MRTRLLCLAIILVFGAIRLPIEMRLEKEQRALHYHGAKFSLSMRQQLSQLGFVAALSGFRAVVASVLELQAYTAWQRVEWGRLKLLYDTVCALQPRNLQAWDMAAWHMAYNASVAAREDDTQPRAALRLKAEREYFKLGENFMLRGIENNPDRAFLFERLATIYRDKFEDHEKAAHYYDEASKRPDAMHYVHRFAVYELAKVPGREREAYERLKALYLKGKDERLPTLLRLLGEMEQKLNVPPSERLYTPPTQK